MNNQVTVVANKNGNAIIPFERNPEYGYVMVQQPYVVNLKSGFKKTKYKKARIIDSVEQLRADGFYPEQTLPGQIVIEERMDDPNPNEDNPEQNIKRAGKGGPILHVEGQPIYRISYYTPDMSLRDTPSIPHSNVDEVKAWSRQQKANAILTEDEKPFS